MEMENQEVKQYKVPEKLRNLNRLAYFKKNHNLKFKFIGKKKKGAYRKNIRYQCLKCGRDSVSTVKAALDNKFICHHCRNVQAEISNMNYYTSKENKFNSPEAVSKYLNPLNQLVLSLSEVFRNNEQAKRSISPDYQKVINTSIAISNIAEITQKLHNLKREEEELKKELAKNLKNLV